jgi:hypothetical protein
MPKKKRTTSKEIKGLPAPLLDISKGLQVKKKSLAPLVNLYKQLPHINSLAALFEGDQLTDQARDAIGAIGLNSLHHTFIEAHQKGYISYKQLRTAEAPLEEAGMTNEATSSINQEQLAEHQRGMGFGGEQTAAGRADQEMPGQAPFVLRPAGYPIDYAAIQRLSRLQEFAPLTVEKAVERFGSSSTTQCAPQRGFATASHWSEASSRTGADGRQNDLVREDLEALVFDTSGPSSSVPSSQRGGASPARTMAPATGAVNPGKTTFNLR